MKRGLGRLKMKDAVNVSPQDIVKLLAEIVGKDNVLHEPYDLITYSRDRYPLLTHPRRGVKPLAVVRPAFVQFQSRFVARSAPRRMALNFSHTTVG